MTFLVTHDIQYINYNKKKKRKAVQQVPQFMLRSFFA